LVKKVKSITKREKILNIYALIKILSGTMLGTLYGSLNINPLIAWVFALIFLIVLILVCRYYFGLNDVRLLNLVAMHGTVGYIVSIIMFWTLTYTLLYS